MQVHVCVSRKLCTFVKPEEVSGSPGAGLPGSCKLSDLCAENQTQVLWKGSRCFVPLSRLSWPRTSGFCIKCLRSQAQAPCNLGSDSFRVGNFFWPHVLSQPFSHYSYFWQGFCSSVDILQPIICTRHIFELLMGRGNAIFKVTSYCILDCFIGQNPSLRRLLSGLSRKTSVKPICRPVAPKVFHPSAKIISTILLLHVIGVMLCNY